MEYLYRVRYSNQFKEHHARKSLLANLVRYTLSSIYFTINLQFSQLYRVVIVDRAIELR